jgi:hypothetical protein
MAKRLQFISLILGAGTLFFQGCAFNHRGTGTALQELEEAHGRDKVLKVMGAPDDSFEDNDFEIFIYSNRDEQSTSGWEAFGMFAEAFAEGSAGNQVDPDKYRKTKNHYYVILRGGSLVFRGLGKISEKRFKRWVRKSLYDEETQARRRVATGSSSKAAR